MSAHKLSYSGSVSDAIDFFDDALATGQIDLEEYVEGTAFWGTFLGDINGDGIQESLQGTVEFQLIRTGSTNDFERAHDPWISGGPVEGVWQVSFSYADGIAPATAEQLVEAYANNGIDFGLAVGPIEQNAAIAIPAYQDYTIRSKTSDGIDAPWDHINISSDILIL